MSNLFTSEFKKRRAEPYDIFITAVWDLNKKVIDHKQIDVLADQVEVKYYIADGASVLKPITEDRVRVEFNLFQNIPAGHKTILKSLEADENGAWVVVDDLSENTSDIEE